MQNFKAFSDQLPLTLTTLSMLHAALAMMLITIPLAAKGV